MEQVSHLKCSDCQLTDNSDRFRKQYNVSYDCKTEKITQETIIFCPKCNSTNIKNVINGMAPNNNGK